MAMDGTTYSRAAIARSLNSPIICFSSVPWRNAGRIRALMERFACNRQMFFLEEPVRSDNETLRIQPCASTGVQVVTPMLPTIGAESRREVLELLLARSGPAIAWYTAPEARSFSDHVPWLAVVYDCAADPAPAWRPLEGRLIQEADLVFAGGLGLHEDRRDLHPNVHCFPGGIDVESFEAARRLLPEPDDQIGLRRPLLGRFGVVDDNLDFDLLVEMAALRPQWHFAMIGPIETARELPRPGNIHWLGERDEAELPAYLSHWDLAVMPLARHAVADSTEALRYLAGGRRVVSTPVREVRRRFAGLEAVALAEDAAGFVAAAEQAMLRADVSDFVAVDDFLETVSWDAIQQHMAALLNMAERNAGPRPAALPRFGSMTVSAAPGERLAAR